MNDIEKMIWALVFTTKYQPRVDDPPAWAVENNMERWDEWESQSVSGAAEDAGGTIESLRKHGPSFIEGFKGFDIADYMVEVLKRED